MRTISPRIRLGYATGSVASATYGTVPGLLMLPYLTDALGIEAAIAGLIVFAPKAWDFFLNPVAGRWSDQWQGTGDRRRPFVLWGGIGMALAFAAMFLGPLTPAGAGAVWVVAFFLLAATGFALFQVPYLAMAAELTDDTHERTRLIGGRVIVLTLTILLVGATAPLLVEAAGRPAGYRLMAVVMACLIAVGAIMLWWGTRGASLTRTHAPRGRFIAQLRIVLADANARWLVSTFVIQGVAMTMVLAGIAYFARHVLGTPSASALIFVCCVAPALIVTPLWTRFARRFGTKRGFATATAFCTVGLVLMMPVAATGQLALLVVAAAFVGIGYSGAQLFPLAMLAEVAADDERRSGENRIGLISGVWSGVDLLGSAFGPAIFGAVLSVGGYLATTDAAVQPDSAVVAIVGGMAVIPAVLFAVSLVPLSRYRLGDRSRVATPAG